MRSPTVEYALREMSHMAGMDCQPAASAGVVGRAEQEKQKVAQPLFRADAVNVGSLDTLIEHVPAGTVSRSLIVAPAFRQVLFSMDAGQEISEHRSPFLAIVQVLSGRLRMEVSGQAHVMEAAGWLSMPADAPHALRAEAPTRFLLTMFREPTEERGTR